MSISTWDQYVAALKQRVEWCKTAGRTVVALNYFTGFDLAGNPGAGTINGTTVNGVLQTPAVTGGGYPTLNFTSGVGYLTRVEFGNTVACRFQICDCLVKYGTFGFGAGTTTPTPGTQPATSGRCPDYPGSGNNWGNGCEIWIEVSTAFLTGNAWSVQVTYTDDRGGTGHTTPAITVMAAAALTLGKRFMLPLASGDDGVQKIESVIVSNPVTAMTAGAFNVLILRPLYTIMRVGIANGGDNHEFFKTGAPIVYNTSALDIMVQADSTAFGVPEFTLEIASA